MTSTAAPSREPATDQPDRMGKTSSVLVALLRRHLRPYRGAVVTIIVLQLVATIVALYLPSLNADIIDRGVARGDTGYIIRIGALMLLVTLLQIGSTIVAVYFAARTSMRLGRDLRQAIFAHVGTFSEREVQQFGAPSLITRNTNDVTQVQMLTLMTFTMMVVAPIMCVGGIIMALRQDVGLSWLLVVALPVLVVAIGLIAVRMLPQFRLMQIRLDAVNRVLREQITGVRVVRAFVREQHETERFADANVKLTDTALRVGKLMALMFPIVMLIMNGSSVAVLWFGAERIDAGLIGVGTLTAFLSYLIQILMAIVMATFMLVMVPRAAVCADRIDEVLTTDPSVRWRVDADRSMGMTCPRGRVVLEDVSFSYPGAAEPVLRDISLTAEPGRTTAIIGSTGSGKTTLISLIPRLFDVTGGRVTVGGVDVRDADPDDLWRTIALVPQRSYLFSGTVASTLRFGHADATDDQLWEALEVAQAAGFVRDMPGGLDAPIAQGGTNVSGGQRQRLAIARALVRRPDVYLFDDSFSALDVATDARLRAALPEHIHGATVIVVAQRVSTIRQAERIVVLDAGTVVGTGTHDELLADCPTYQEIVTSQAAGEST